jgi:hypothetical protein
VSKPERISSLLDSTSAASWLHMDSGETIEAAMRAFKVAVPCEANEDLGAKINAVKAAFPGRVYLVPGGTRYMQTRVNFTENGECLEGPAIGTTIIDQTASSAQGAIRFGPANPSLGTYLEGGGIKGITLQCEAAGSTGVGLLVESVLEFREVDVCIKDYKINRDLVGFSNYRMRGAFNFQGSHGDQGAGSRAMRIRPGYSGGVPDVRTPYGLHMTECSISGWGEDAARVETMIEVQALDGWYTSGTFYVGQAKNLIDFKLLNNSVYFSNISITGGILDGNNAQSEYGIRFRDTPGAVQAIAKVSFTGLNVTTFLYDAYYCDAFQAEFSVVGGQIQGAQRRGMNLVTARTVTVAGVTFSTNGTAADATTGAMAYTSNVGVLLWDASVVRDTPTGAKAAIASGYPTRLEQSVLGDLSVPIPIITSRRLECGVRTGITAATHTYEACKVAIQAGDCAIVTIEASGLVGGVAAGRRLVTYSIIWTGAIWAVSAPAGLPQYTDSASADFFAFSTAVTGAGVTFSIAINPSLTTSRFTFQADLKGPTSSLSPGADFL